MFDLAAGYRDRGMAAYSELQQREFAREKEGYTCELGGSALAALAALAASLLLFAAPAVLWFAVCLGCRGFGV